MANQDNDNNVTLKKAEFQLSKLVTNFINDEKLSLTEVALMLSKQTSDVIKMQQGK